jgi:hypothetical protein
MASGVGDYPDLPQRRCRILEPGACKGAAVCASLLPSVRRRARPARVIGGLVAQLVRARA